MTGTDENNTNMDGGVGPFSEDYAGLSGEESEDAAVEFAEDPIEKTRQNKRNYNAQPSREIPDRNRLEEIREQAINNFMLSPWVVPGPDDETDTP